MASATASMVPSRLLETSSASATPDVARMTAAVETVVKATESRRGLIEIMKKNPSGAMVRAG
jgi:hypothetical protein